MKNSVFPNRLQGRSYSYLTSYLSATRPSSTRDLQEIFKGLKAKRSSKVSRQFAQSLLLAGFLLKNAENYTGKKCNFLSKHPCMKRGMGASLNIEPLYSRHAIPKTPWANIHGSKGQRRHLFGCNKSVMRINYI